MAANNALYNPSTVTALLISPFESDHSVMRLMFSHSNWRLLEALDYVTALGQIREASIPVVICSADPRGDGWKTIFRETATMAHPPRIIVFSRQTDEGLWAEVVQHGAFTLLDTPFDMRDIVIYVSLAWHSWCLEVRQGSTPLKGVRTRGVPAWTAIAG